MFRRITSDSRFFCGLLAGLLLHSPSLTAEPDKAQVRPLPGALELSEISESETMNSERKELVDLALSLGRKHRLNSYLFGSADPAKGGFDCSGSMYFILTEAGLKPARSSAAQYEWIKQAGLLSEVPKESHSLDAPVFEKLMPGDLVFWAGTYQPTDGRTNKVTHVQMYLGIEEATGKPVMIGSSDGRSYAGTARCGFGVYEFRVPRKGSKSRIVGFGPPPGLLPKDDD
ncbi:C40 family peptidase [Haloferula sp.]|uniref:C40 family peptidase n=1 Tax=Haloferula sp. TaxID=2497595 RepID=UPI00329ADF11